MAERIGADVPIGPTADLPDFEAYFEAIGDTGEMTNSRGPSPSGVRRPTADGRSPTKGALAGAIGGLVASFVMTQFAELWTRLAEGHESHSSGGEHDARDWQERSEDRNATELVAQRIAETTIDRRLTHDELGVAAPIVHYAFGITTAAAYGAAAEAFDANPLTGAAFGTAVWLGADNVGVPLLRLSDGPQRYTSEMYAQGLAAHLVYGITTEVVRRIVRGRI